MILSYFIVSLYVFVLLYFKLNYQEIIEANPEINLTKTKICIIISLLWLPVAILQIISSIDELLNPPELQ